MTLLGLKTNLKCLTIFSIIMSSVARTFCNKPDDLTSTLNPAVEPSTCMSFRIPITTLIVSWSARTVLALKGSPLLQNKGNSRVTFPKLPSLYTLYWKTNISIQDKKGQNISINMHTLSKRKWKWGPCLDCSFFNFLIFDKKKYCF